MPLLNNDATQTGLFRAGGCCGGGDGFEVSWPDRLNSYLKSKNVFYCPDVLSGADGNVGDYCHYGFSMFFVKYIDADIRGSVAGNVMLNSAKITSPSNTIMLTDHREAAKSTAGAWALATQYTYIFNYMASPQAAGWNCSQCCACLMDPVDPRHTGRFNAAFADGHVKSLVVNTTASGDDVGGLYGQIGGFGSTNDLGVDWTNAANATAKPYWCPYN